MATTMKAKTSPTGYVALIDSRDHRIELPIARFDDEGYAMASDFETGRLVRAAEMGGFIGVKPMWQTGGAR